MPRYVQSHLSNAQVLPCRGGYASAEDAERWSTCLHLQVYLASASPPVRFPNVYGVDMPVRKEFVASDKTEEEICTELGADALIYQSIEDLVAVGHDLNPSITEFDTSCFTGGSLPHMSSPHAVSMGKIAKLLA